VSERRGCAALRFDRSSHRYRAIRNEQAVLRGRIRELAAARVRYGYFRIYILLRHEGWRINHKRVYWLYRQEGLSMRLKRPRRHVVAAHRQARPAAGALNDRWSMDFVSDALFDGRRIRALTVVDDYSRESLAIEVGESITGEQVVAVMNRIVAARGAPTTIRVDNVLRRESRSPLEQSSPVACGASGFGNRAHQRLCASSLRCGAPSRVRSEASPANAALDDAVAPAEGQLCGSISSRVERQSVIQPSNPGGFHVSGKALTIMNKGSSGASRDPNRTQNRVPARVEGPNIIYGVSKAIPTARCERAHPPGIASSKKGR